jgi:hypothetical protein
MFQIMEYPYDEKLAEMFNVVQKEDSWTSAPICEAVTYKEAQFQNGDLASILNSRSTGNKKLDAVLPCGDNEMIIPNTLEFFYTTTYTANNSTDWVMTADGTRPAGVPGNFQVLKPKTGFAYPGAITADGVRAGKYCVSSQLNKISMVMSESGAVVDSLLDSNSRSTTSLLQNVIVDQYCNSQGVNTTANVATCNDLRFSMPDMLGSLTSTKTEIDTTSNTLINTRRVKRGDVPVALSEVCWNRIWSADRDCLLSSLKSEIATARAMPPGMSLRVTLDVLDGPDRLVTDLVCTRQVDQSTTEDAPLGLKFETCVLRYQVLKLSPDMVNNVYRSGYVMGSDESLGGGVPMTGTETETLPEAIVARYVVTDLTQQYKTLATGTVGDTYAINSGDKEVLCPFYFTYLTAANNGSFTTAAMHTSNWSCLNWVDKSLTKFRASTSSGQADRSIFLDMYPNNDIDLKLASESSIMLNCVSGNYFWNQIATGRRASLMALQATLGLTTWLRSGWEKADLPVQSAVSWYADPSSSVTRDAAIGLLTSQLSITTSMDALPANKNLVVAQFNRKDIVLNISGRTVGRGAIRPTFSENREYSGYALRAENARSKENICIQFIYNIFVHLFVDVNLLR